MACHGGPNIVEDNLVLCLDAGNTKSYDDSESGFPGGGGTWNDISGKGHTATINGATFNSGNGGCFIFDGTDDYITLGTQLNSTIAPNSEDNDASFSFWVNLDDVANDQTIFSNPKKLSNIPILLYYDLSTYASPTNTGTDDVGGGTVNVLSVLMKDADTQYVMTTANNAVSSNTWYNIVIVLNPSNDVHYIYLNGVEVAKFNSSAANNLSTITDDLTIGAADNDSSTMEGKFAHFMAYTAALTSSEVKQNYDALKSRYVYYGGSSETNLVLHLDANNYSGSGDWLDETSNDNDGTISGATYTNDGDADYFDFDGSNDYVELAEDSTLQLTGDCTFEFWVKPHNVSGGSQGLISRKASSFNTGGFVIVLDHSSASDKFGLFHKPDNSSSRLCETSTLSNDTWYHIVFSKIGSTITPYTNNVAGTAGTSTNTIQLYGTGSDNSTFIGKYWNGEFNGEIAVAKIYKGTGLTASQVTQNYDALKGRYQ